MFVPLAPSPATVSHIRAGAHRQRRQLSLWKHAGWDAAGPGAEQVVPIPCRSNRSGQSFIIVIRFVGLPDGSAHLFSITAMEYLNTPVIFGIDIVDTFIVVSFTLSKNTIISLSAIDHLSAVICSTGFSTSSVSSECSSPHDRTPPSFTGASGASRTSKSSLRSAVSTTSSKKRVTFAVSPLLKDPLQAGPSQFPVSVPGVSLELKGGARGG